MIKKIQLFLSFLYAIFFYQFSNKNNLWGIAFIHAVENNNLFMSKILYEQETVRTNKDIIQYSLYVANKRHYFNLFLFLFPSKLIQNSDYSFFNLIYQNDNTYLTRIILNDERFDQSAHFVKLFESLIQRENVKLMKLMINEFKFDPSYRNDNALELAAHLSLIKPLSLLLSDPRVNPANNKNIAIKTAYINNDKDIIDLLWKSKKVKKTLSSHHNKLYNILIKKDLEQKINYF